MHRTILYTMVVARKRTTRCSKAQMLQWSLMISDTFSSQHQKAARTTSELLAVKEALQWCIANNRDVKLGRPAKIILRGIARKQQEAERPDAVLSLKARSTLAVQGQSHTYLDSARAKPCWPTTSNMNISSECVEACDFLCIPGALRVPFKEFCDPFHTGSAQKPFARRTLRLFVVTGFGIVFMFDASAAEKSVDNASTVGIRKTLSYRIGGAVTAHPSHTTYKRVRIRRFSKLTRVGRRFESSFATRLRRSAGSVRLHRSSEPAKLSRS